MPVRHASQQTDEVGRFNRLSASQANTYRSCPRLWFYEKVYRFKMPQIPVLFVGRAVEEALCRVLKESPNLLVAASGIEVFGESPYSEDGLPVEDVVWPASMLMPLFPEERPDSKEAIEAWASTGHPDVAESGAAGPGVASLCHVYLSGFRASNSSMKICSIKL